MFSGKNIVPQRVGVLNFHLSLQSVLDYKEVTMRKIPCVIMRGGTSRGAVFHRSDLPSNIKEWDNIFIKTMGSPDPKQIDGLGGGVSSNNKIVVVSKSDREGVDVEYTIGQVLINKPEVDYKSNCGNMTSVVGPFSIDEGLVKALEPITKVVMYNTNTGKIIEALVPVENGRFKTEGDCKIAGVLGTSSEIKLSFINPGGAVTGRLLPTNKPKDILDIPQFGNIEATIIDASNPLVIIRAEDINLKGFEKPDDINSNEEVLDLLEKIRGIAAEKICMVENWRKARDLTPAIPKIAFVTSPIAYDSLTGEVVSANDMDICARVISLNKLHKAYPITAAIATGVAARIKGSIISDLIYKDKTSNRISIGHPSGIITVDSTLTEKNKEIYVEESTVIRTARRIMDGYIYIQD